MARIPEIERRLNNWARWRASMSAGGGNYATVELGAMRVDGQGWDAPTVIPTNDAEADETERAVQSLPVEQRDAVFAAYVGTRSVAERARRLGVSLSTLYARVDTAHLALARRFAEAREAAEAERKRVEVLQRAPSIFKSGAAAPAPVVARAPTSALAAWLAERRRARGFTG